MFPDMHAAAAVSLSEGLCASLRERGFVRHGHLYRHHDLTFLPSGHCWVLSERSVEADIPPLSQALAQPGLWKWVRANGTARRVFEIPTWLVSHPRDAAFSDDSGAVPIGRLLDWALGTRFRSVPAGWAPPAPGLVALWLPRGALTVQAHGCVRQGELVLEPGLWALRVPLLPALPADLPAPRRRALEELVLEAQSRWAMVRFGTAPGDSVTTLRAEVDFSGAPHSEPLFSTGLDVLRHVFAWLVETAEVLADPAVGIQGLDGGWNTTKPTKGT